MPHACDDGKEHRYWSIVESCRNLDGRVVQRQVLYLGEINDSQKAAWCRIDVLQTDSSAKQMALFPTAVKPQSSIVKWSQAQRATAAPSEWGACWLALKLWRAVGTRPVLAAAFASESPRHAVA